MPVEKEEYAAPELPDDISECEPPDPISNSEVKVHSADGSVGLPHVRLGHCQALYLEQPRTRLSAGFFYGCLERRTMSGHGDSVFGGTKILTPSGPHCGLKRAAFHQA